jgi:hypothetical protein
MPALLTAAATAAAALSTWTGPIGVPAGDPPLAAVPAPAAGGGALIVRGQSYTALPYLSGTPSLTVQRMSAAGAFGRVSAVRGAVLVRSRPRSDGGDDLLVWRLDTKDRTRGRLALVRATAAGALRTLWTAPEPSDTRGDVARDARGRYAIAYINGGSEPDGRQTVRVVTSADGRRFTRPRALSREGRAVRFALPTSVGVAVGPHGAPIAVLTQFVRSAPPGRTTALQARANGTIVTRWALGRADGTVSTEQAPDGRVAVLVHDSGIEGEFGECVGDGRGRHVSATASTAGARAFPPLRDLADQKTYCPDGGAPRLLALPGDAFAVVFGAIDVPGQPGDVRVAPTTADRSAGFAQATTVWPGLQLAGAAADPRDGTLVVALQHADAHGYGQGVSIATRAPDGRADPRPHRHRRAHRAGRRARRARARRGARRCQWAWGPFHGLAVAERMPPFPRRRPQAGRAESR